MTIGTNDSVLSRDFASVARLGFNSVFALGGDDAARASAGAAASKAGLRLVPASPTAPASQPQAELAPRSVVMMSAADFASLPSDESYSAWLAAYHAKLAAGATERVRIETYRSKLDPARGLVEGSGEPAPGTAATLRRLLTRAARWGPRLCGLTPRQIAAEDPTDAELQIVMFEGRRSRYLLLSNLSADHFVHTSVTLAAEDLGREIERAVCVPANEPALAPEVVHGRRGLLVYDVHLPPGDAMLYELF